jgi:Cys-tRNA(Pro) deacylase
MSDDVAAAAVKLAPHNVKFALRRFDYQEGGGTARSSGVLGVSEHAVIKTLIFENDQREAIVVLMHGDRNVDTKVLALELGMAKIWSCAPAVAEGISGWPVGATNPFALKSDIPIFMEATVLELPKMYVNAGGRGLLVELAPADFLRVIQPRLVRCAKEKRVLVSKAP